MIGLLRCQELYAAVESSTSYHATVVLTCGQVLCLASVLAVTESFGSLVDFRVLICISLLVHRSRVTKTEQTDGEDYYTDLSGVVDRFDRCVIYLNKRISGE